VTETIDSLKSIWDKTLADLKAQVSDQTFTVWFDPIKPINLNDKGVTLGVPNDFFKDWLSERYMPLIKASFSQARGRQTDILFSVVKSAENQDASPVKETPSKEKKGLFRSLFPKQGASVGLTHTGVNPRYTFDSFVIGPSNRFAHAACLAVSESPAKTYNPLFIYGGVGLGKTHLMHAMGNSILLQAPRLKIVYISSEDFTNQLIGAIQTRSTEKFRAMYRSVDILLIDDIHFIAGKEATQEEFFHTFNALYDAHKQIIMSSDRSPKEISSLEERLVSRFEWGLVTDIQPPDFETRMAILKKKGEQETLQISDDVLYFLAENIRSNIRELEGGLIRLVAFSKMFGKSVSVDLAKEVLKGMLKEGSKKVNVDHIQKKVAAYFNIAHEDMKAKKRTQTLAYPRQIAMYLSREMTDLSLPEIGAYFGGRDHTTVIHACTKIEKAIKDSEDVHTLIEHLISVIKE